VAIDAQLDPDAPPEYQQQKLKQAAAKICYWQKRAAETARFHRARRERELRARGIDLDQVPRCPDWPTVPKLDFAEPLDPARWAPS
jgi:hypothetical protein